MAAAILLAAVLAGCRIEDPQAVPGDQPEPFQESVMGANARVGSILLRSVHIEAPADVRYQPGDNAKLWFTMVNEGRTTDVLTAISSPVARATDIRWDADCDGQFQTVPTLLVRPAELDPTGEPSGIPPFDAYFAQLTNLNREVLAGTAVPVTFSFREAGAVTVEALVQPSSAVRPEPSTRCYGPSASPESQTTPP